MKVLILNGSYRKKGATALILNEMYQQLIKYSNIDVRMVHVADLSLKYCVGCGNCYKTGTCIYKDDIEILSQYIADADGIILGSPTYASNVSGQMKVIIDRGHFVIEQLLYGKYAIGVITYENYGGRDAAKVLNRLLSYSGGKISSSITYKNIFNTNPLDDYKLKKKIGKVVHSFYIDILKRRKYLFQSMKHLLIFRLGIQPFVMSKGTEYEGVIKHWKKRKLKFKYML